MSAPDAAEALLQSLERLRDEGAARVDPVRFRYLEALARRLPDQQDPVRRLLHEKLQQALADYAERVAQARQAPAARGLRLSARAACAPLVQLNQSIRAARGREPQERDELASVRRFRRAWSSSRSHDQMEQAAARKPANAGPLNSHVLVLDTLALMRELSPDYLRRFLVQVESLQWLEQAKDSAAPVKPAKQAKPVRRARQKK